MRVSMPGWVPTVIMYLAALATGIVAARYVLIPLLDEHAPNQDNALLALVVLLLGWSAILLVWAYQRHNDQRMDWMERVYGRKLDEMRLELNVAEHELQVTKTIVQSYRDIIDILVTDMVEYKAFVESRGLDQDFGDWVIEYRDGQTEEHLIDEVV